MNIKRNGRQRESKSRLLYPLLAVVLVLSMIMAVPGLSKEARAVELNRSDCSLTIAPGESELADDLAKANVAVDIDIYKIADATSVDGYDAYSYSFLNVYEKLKKMYYEDYKEKPDADGSKAMAQEAAKVALSDSNPIKPKTIKYTGADFKASGLECGLYLLIARGSGLTDVKDYKTTVINDKGESEIATVANSDKHVYTFAPVLVSLPNKEDANGDPSNTTAGNGNWMYNMKVMLKPQQGPRYGSLEITKNLKTYKMNSDATFLFQVEAELNGTSVYKDIVTMIFKDEKPQTVKIEDKIPVGAKVTVTEIYSGASYKLVAGSMTQTVTISAADASGKVEFTNDYAETTTSGGGVNNNFTYGYNEEGEKGWNWKDQP